LVQLHWGKVKQVILATWKFKYGQRQKIDYERGNKIKSMNLNLKMTKNLWYVILGKKSRAKVKAIIDP
jgi:hypothetical protein